MGLDRYPLGISNVFWRRFWFFGLCGGLGDPVDVDRTFTDLDWGPTKQPPVIPQSIHLEGGVRKCDCNR